MTLVLFALPRYLVVLLLCTSAYFIGQAVLQRLTFHSVAERLSLCVTFGLGVLSHLILLIGLCGWLTLTGVALAIAVVTGVSILICLRRTIPNKKPDGTVRPLWLRWIASIGLLIVAGAALFSIWLLPLYPPTDFDVTMYHLAAPKAWVQADAVIATPFLRGPVLPHSAHTLFASLLLAKDDIAAQILSLVATCLVGMGLYGWGKRLHGNGTGILAAALWIGSPAVLALAGVASYHALGSLFAFASIYTLATYANTGRLTWLFAAGAFLGFAQSTWPGTVFFVPVLAVASGYFAIRERRLLPLCGIAAGILLGWGPALARAMWYTGNPTFPLLTEVFGTGPWWTAQDVAGIGNDIRRYGIPRTFLNFLSIPYALLSETAKFQSAQGYSVMLSIMLPAVAIRSIRDTCVRWLALTVLFYVACWFVSGQIMRYLLPIVPVLCITTAVSTTWIADRIGQVRRAVSTGLIALITAGSLLPGFLYARSEIASRGPVPMTTEARVAYISARIPQYAAMAVANVAPGPVYSVFGTNCAYYADGPFMGDWFGPGRYSQVLDSLQGGKRLYTTLHRLGARYFLVSLIDHSALLLPNDQEFDSHFELLFANAAAELYLIHDSPRSVSTNRTNLLRNAGFDEVENNQPIAWRQFGKPIIAKPQTGAVSGDLAVAVTDADGLDQLVRVTPPDTYELALQARADKPATVFRLQVNWMDREGKVCEVFIRVYNATADWKEYSCRMTTPLCAEIADVYASGQSGEPVWLDSFVFRSAKATPLE